MAGVASEPDRLLELVYVDAVAAERAARTLLDNGMARTPIATAKLHWVIGLALRDRGELDGAMHELKAGHAAAREADDHHLTVRITSSLAFVHGLKGDLDTAVTMLELSADGAAGADRALLRGQLGTILYWRGELADAARLLRESTDVLATHDEHVMEARYRANLGAVLSLMGQLDEAVRQLELAASSAETHGLNSEAAMARSNLGWVATLRGDLPGAIEHFTAAEVMYTRAGDSSMLPRLHADHAQALADAGLFTDADALVSRAVDMYREQGQQTELAGALLTLAEIRVAEDEIDDAIAAGQEAAGLFEAQSRPSWATLARALALQARARRGVDDAALPPALLEASDSLVHVGWPADALRARLAAAKLLAERGEETAGLLDGPTRRAVLRGRAADQILVAYVDAVAASARGQASRARRAISRGLAVAMSAQAALGSIEARAHAAVHGNSLTEIGARMAIGDGRPRELLARIEATRVMAARTPSIRPPADPALAQLLAELRSLDGKLADPSASDKERHDAETAHVRIEREVRRLSRTARGDANTRISLQRELGAALAQLGDRQLLAHARLDGRLHAVSIVAGKARLHDLGPLDDVNERIEAVTFSLHRLNRIQGSDESRLAAAEMLYAFADELAEIVLPPIVAESLDSVVIVPTAILHDVPWGLLPPLAGRSVSVNPSVSAWGHAERTLRQRRGTLRDGIDAGFVAGPGLDFADVEVKHLAGGYVDPVVLVGEEATVAACTGLLSRAELVHIACHGSFRRDNPMFSSLHVADGPLNIYDLEGLERLPVVVVLSSCSVANAKVVQGGSLLGLANAFTTLGAASVIAPLTPISDAASVTVMDRLHREFIAGADPAAALAAATMTHDVADPTAAAFIALGA